MSINTDGSINELAFYAGITILTFIICEINMIIKTRKEIKDYENYIKSHEEQAHRNSEGSSRSGRDQDDGARTGSILYRTESVERLPERSRAVGGVQQRSEEVPGADQRMRSGDHSESEL